MNNTQLQKKLVPFLFSAMVLITNNLFSTSYVAIASGNWSSSTTWASGRVPADNDSIYIGSAFTVSVDINSPTYVNMAIYVAGTIDFQNGQKINMCPGSLSVFDGGLLTGGTPGSKINICGSTVWNGPGPTPGPLEYGTAPTSVINLLMASATNARSSGSTARIGLTWTTLTEEKNTSFEIRRSSNGLSFTTIGTVQGVGASSSPQDYSFNDESPEIGTNYYRVIMFRDGKEVMETQKTIAGNISEETKGCVLSVFPNPCVGECQVRLSDCPSDNEGAIVVEMVDANGSTVSSTTPERDINGGFSMTINAENNLAPGMYIIRGTSNKKAYTQKAILK